MARKSDHASTTKIKSEQVCVQLPTSADNVTLPTFAANRHAAAPCCGTAAAGRPAAAAVDRYLLPAGPTAAKPPQRRAAAE